MKLQSGDWEAVLRPEVGGCLASLTHRGTEVLRTMPEGSTEPLESACFPLVPYCNRIGEGRFEWQGYDVQLPANFAPEPHSLHGLGWHQPWTVVREAGFKCALEHRHDGGDSWPWPYIAEQRVRLGPKGCAITLDLTNRSAEPMPCGIGLHPYLRRTMWSRVSFGAEAMFEVGEDSLPTGALVPSSHFGDWSRGASLPELTIDHCFAGWDGTASVSDELGRIMLTARGASFLHLYSPRDGSALCLEPVSHAPDAPNRAPDELIVLPPGCTASLTMWIGLGG